MIRTLPLFLLIGCTDGSPPPAETGELVDPDTADTAETASPVDTALPATWPWPEGSYGFATEVVDFTAGDGAGFGYDEFPGIVLGEPVPTPAGGSTDVLSLGLGGSITLTFGAPVVDGPGPDLVVFENPFPGWIEPGIVEVSADGEVWHAFPCAAEAPFEGCAGLTAAAYPLPGPDVQTLADVGGDAFDLADLGLTSITHVRITDAGTAAGYEPPGGGFDLDAVMWFDGEKAAAGQMLD